MVDYKFKIDFLGDFIVKFMVEGERLVFVVYCFVIYVVFLLNL